MAIEDADMQGRIWSEMLKENRDRRISKDGTMATNSKDVRRLLERIYDPILPADALGFHVQDSKGFPHKDAVTRTIAGKDIKCTVAFTNELSARKWKKIPRPSGFFGEKWPPETVDDLLGCSTLGEPCMECEFGDKDTRHRQYEDWSAKMWDFWLDKIQLCEISEDRGLGLRARDAIYNNTCIGEYTGELVPGDAAAAVVQTQYHYDIPIGRMARESKPEVPKRSIGTQTGGEVDPENNVESRIGDGEAQADDAEAPADDDNAPKSDSDVAKTGSETSEADSGPDENMQTYCWLDATRRGSVFRFMNHSCDPNAEVQPGRCGVHNRILYVFTTRPIFRGEQITISYGDHWYSTPDNPCLCMSKKCKNPPRAENKDDEKEDGEDAGKRNSKGFEATGHKAVVEKRKKTSKETTDQATNALHGEDEDEDEVMKDGTDPKPELHPTSAQANHQDKQSSEASEPVQPKKRGRLVRGKKTSRMSTPPTRRSPRLNQNAARSSSPTRRRSSRLSPDPYNRVAKQSPRRGPIEPATGQNEGRTGPGIRLKTLTVPKGQKKHGAK